MNIPQHEDVNMFPPPASNQTGDCLHREKHVEWKGMKKQSWKYIFLKFLLSCLGLCLKSSTYACAYDPAYVIACVACFITFHCFAFCFS